MDSYLDYLPPGSPDLHLPALPTIALPRSFHVQQERGFEGLEQREVDGMRIHFYLLFYEEHALLWSSIEQHFADLDEARFNRALAWLEEVDAVEITPAPAPNPFSPPDALVTLLPDPEVPYDIATQPLPWPGSHIHSPQIPMEPAPLPFGFPVNLTAEEYHAQTTGHSSVAGTGEETRDSGRQTSNARPGLTGLGRATNMSHLKMGTHHIDTLSSLSSRPPMTSTGTFNELQMYKIGTITPPPSDMWMSEEPTPMFMPVKRSGDAEDDDEVEPYSLDGDALEIGPGALKSTFPQLSGPKSRRGSLQQSKKPLLSDITEESRLHIPPAKTPTAHKPVMGWTPLRLTEDAAPSGPTDGTTSPHANEFSAPCGFDGDTDLGLTWRLPTTSPVSEPRMTSQQEMERLEELREMATASVVPPLSSFQVTHKEIDKDAVISRLQTPLQPRAMPMIGPAVLLPIALSLIMHPVLSAASASPTLRSPAFVNDLLGSLPASTFPALEANVGFSIIAFLGMMYAVPWMGEAFMSKNLKGRDMLKGEAGQVIPECMGLPGAAGYIGLMIMFIPFPFSKYFEDSLSGWGAGGMGDLEALRMEKVVGRRTFPHQELALYLSSILCLLIATLLGFLDDVFDIRWRHKLPIPVIASIPLLMVYYAEGGLTTVVMPRVAQGIFGHTVDLGPLYYVYMSLLSTFSTNSINILAGVNGLEVGQALVIALSVALNDTLYLPIWPRIAFGQPGTLNELVLLEGGPILRRGSEELIQRHLLSLYFMGPLIGVCLGLLYHNWYPARAFVGDTFCYFAGMAFAVVAVQGHFSKTLLLFFIPQIFNFLLSCPQLFHLVACPRHRLPKLDSSTGLLQPSTVTFPRPPPIKTVLILKLLKALKLTRIEFDDHGTITSATNLTIMTVILVHKPMREPDLTKTIMWLQVLGTGFAFFVRYGIASLLYDGDRR